MTGSLTLGVQNHFYHSESTFEIGSLCNSIVHQIWYSIIRKISPDGLYPNNQQPPWSTLPCCPCPRQCRRPSNYMYLMLSNVRYVESINNFHNAYHHHSISRSSRRKFQPEWCQRPPSRMSLSSTLLMTTNSHLLFFGQTCWSIENSHVNHHSA